MKTLIINRVYIILIVYLFVCISCSEEKLDVEPYGSINESTLANKSGINGLLIGAYSLLDSWGASGGTIWSSLTVLSSMASDDAHVGTEPNAPLAAIEGYSYDPTLYFFDERWRFQYAAVQRANDVIRLLPKVKDISEEERIQILAESRFLRGVYHLQAAMLWRNIPFVNEEITYGNGNYNLSNTESVWPKIEADFKFAADNLTETKSEVGRANKWAAKSFLVKTLMFQNKYSEAKPIVDDVIENGNTSNGLKYDLAEEYFDNFKTEKKHGPEAVFVAQMSVYDGSNGANGNRADAYNGPFGGPPTCCYGWLQPSFDFANSFQTDPVTGLPLIDDYYNTPIVTDQGLSSSDDFTPYQGTLDPRLDWTVGRRGIPYLDWGLHPGAAWIRQQNTGGPYSVIKNIAWQARKDSDRENGYATNNPYNLIRFADVLLWSAEIEVEMGNLERAEELVNRVRKRAANPKGWVKKYIDKEDPLRGFSDEPAANYKVGLYSGEFVRNGKDFAREAVRFERKLELGMEHHRYFDLQRYDNGSGYMAQVLNTYLQREANVPSYNNSAYMPPNATFTKGKNELYPIPQTQIDLSVTENAAKLVQNNGY